MARPEMYELVWSEPMATLAPKFGISDVALKKRCTARGIPTPPRGYWAKKEAGQQPRKAKLPESVPVKVPKTAQRKFAEAMVYYAGSRADYPVSRAHRISVATREALGKKHAAQYDQIRSYGDAARLWVSSRSTRRALWVLDQLIKEATSLGMRVESRDGYDGGLFFHVGQEYAEVEIREKVRRFDRPDYDPNRKVRWPERNDQYEFKSCGLLRIKAKFSYLSSSEWLDSTKNSLDDCIADVAIAILAGIQSCRDLRELRYQKDLRQRERERVELARQAVAEAEEERRRDLEHLAQSLTLSRQVAAFADAVEQRSREAGHEPSTIESLSRWLRWTREHAQRLDPIQETVASLLQADK